MVVVNKIIFYIMYYFNFIAENKIWSVWTIIYSTLTFFGFYYLHINDWPFDIPLIIMGIIWILIGIEATIIFCVCKPNKASMITSVLNSSIAVLQISQEINNSNQGYRNRYNLIDWPSVNYNFCEINKGLWFWHFKYMNLNCCLCSTMVAAVNSGDLFSQLIRLYIFL